MKIHPVALVALGCASARAFAQQASGTAYVEARCSGSTTTPVLLGDSTAASLHGECPAPGGPASINDATCRWTVVRGGVVLGALATTDFFGTQSGAGSAAAQLGDIRLSADDLLFTNIANPQTGGTIAASLNYVLSDQVLSQGQSNCSPFRPWASVSFNVGMSGLAASGQRSYDPSSGLVVDGAMAHGPGDGTPFSDLTSEGQVGLNAPQTLTLLAGAAGTVLYCDFPPAAFGQASADLAWHLPCGTPVFNLPAGYTVNSAQLGIVNNLFIGLSVTSQPQDAVICPFGSASFTTTATGFSTVSYQWQWRSNPSAPWADVTEGTNSGPSNPVFSAQGSRSGHLVITPPPPGFYPWMDLANAQVKCVVGGCGEVATRAVALRLCGSNCDCSTTSPSLNVLDFACFLNRFAAGDAYANCDGSTASPTLNVLDFACFLNSFAAGCT